MPRPRKGTKYVPEISTIIRDAEPTQREIESDPDAINRRDAAIGELLKMYRAAEKHGTVHQLHPEVRMFGAHYNGDIPRGRAGAPTKDHEQLLIKVHVLETIAALGDLRGKVEQALHEVANRHGVTYDHVRDIHYGRGPKWRDPKWRQAVEVEMARRATDQWAAEACVVEATLALPN